MSVPIDHDRPRLLTRIRVDDDVGRGLGNREGDGEMWRRRSERLHERVVGTAIGVE